MRELPIIFSGDMVRAILDGRKTQTRRIIKPQPPENLTNKITHWENQPRGLFAFCNDKELWPSRSFHSLPVPKIKIPYQVGDRLWVKETLFIGQNEESVFYKSDNTHWYPQCHSERVWLSKKQINSTVSSRFMPKWAARIWLEITGVRVERLQDISEKDAIAEGIEHLFKQEDIGKPGIVDLGGWKNYLWHGCAKGKIMEEWEWQYSDYSLNKTDAAKLSFSSLWQSINAKRGYPWQSNPWVTVNTFKRIEATAAL